MSLFGQTSGEVDSRLTAFKVNGTEGKTQLTESSSVKPGDIVAYRLVYQNNQGEPIRQLRPTLPIPEGMIMIPNTATPTLYGAALSAGGAVETLPIKSKRTLPNGLVVETEAKPTEFRQIQWLITEIAPGDSAVFTVQVRVREAEL